MADPQEILALRTSLTKFTIEFDNSDIKKHSGEER